jgi:hypothetical protein
MSRTFIARRGGAGRRTDDPASSTRAAYGLVERGTGVCAGLVVAHARLLGAHLVRTLNDVVDHRETSPPDGANASKED